MGMEEISLLKARGIMVKRVLKIGEEATVWDAVKEMYVANVGAIVVVKNDKEIIGIFSERDILRRVIPKEMNLKKTHICEVMTKDPVTISPDSSLLDVYQQMQGLNLRHIPVVEDDKLIGIISLKDIAKACMKIINRDSP